jgi:hypothetical protein
MTQPEHEEQPMPVPQMNVDSIQSLVRKDLEERERVGVQRYGTPLQAGNGRDALRDAYEEALDLACYLKQAIVERASRDIGDVARVADRDGDAWLLADGRWHLERAVRTAHSGTDLQWIEEHYGPVTPA